MGRTLLTAAALLVALLLLRGAAAPAATVDGLAAYRGDFLAGAVVYALDAPVFDPAVKYARASVPTDASGRFAMEVPPGKYYLVAYRKDAGKRAGFEAGDYYCFYSGNPVRIAGEKVVHVGFNMVRVPADGERTPGFGGVEGRLFFGDEPLGKAYVYVYQNAADEFRGMGFYIAPVGPDGRFKIKLKPGRYFLIGRQRQGGGMYGPLQKNDKVGFYYANPVDVVLDQTVKVSLETISRIEMLEEIWFEKESAGARVMSGTVRNRAGRPVEGVHILLYDNPEASGKPKYISRKTGADGAYRVEVYQDGEYYLVARQSLGGPPGEGEYYGRYRSGGQAAAVSLGPASPEAKVDLSVAPYAAGQ